MCIKREFFSKHCMLYNLFPLYTCMGFLKNYWREFEGSIVMVGVH